MFFLTTHMAGLVRVRERDELCSPCPIWVGGLDPPQQGTRNEESRFLQFRVLWGIESFHGLKRDRRVPRSLEQSNLLSASGIIPGISVRPERGFQKS